MLTEVEFNQYASGGYNRIPLALELLADLETPLSTYLKLCDQPYSFLLESLQGGETWGRYSIIGLPCSHRLEISGKQARYFCQSELIEETTVDNTLACVAEYQQRYKVPEIAELPRFSGGLVGYFGYNTINAIEPHLGNNNAPDPVGAPDIYLMLAEELVIFDNRSGRLSLIVHANGELEDGYQRASKRLDELSSKLRHPAANLHPDLSENAGRKSIVRTSFEEKDFKAAVNTCLDYIHAGDVFQVVLSQRMSTPLHTRPIELYRALRTLNPSPYMFFMDLGEFQIASSSPEILTRSLDGEVTVRPMAGTRRRGATALQDEQLAAELLADPKELAEHLMLIDLGRNDVGRIAEIGSVKLTDKMTIEKYSHVMHIVSNVVGELRADLNALDVLKATFPAGTLSGAPKIRALEIIEELEPEQRGIYSGAIGYLGWHGNMDTAIAIRTAIIRDGMVYVQAGAGIVADSKPENEWQETLNKAKAILAAVEMANHGLHKPLGI